MWIYLGASEADLPSVDSEMKPPKGLDYMVDKVLAYQPKPKSKAAKKRKRKARKWATA